MVVLNGTNLDDYYIAKVNYNGTKGVASAGGDSLTENLNVFYEVIYSLVVSHTGKESRLTIQSASFSPEISVG
jgi:hypothetical protein